MLNIFAIKRSERALCLVAILFFIALNALMIAYNYHLFTKGGNLGFWGLFFDHYTVSGFDNLYDFIKVESLFPTVSPSVTSILLLSFLSA